MKTSILLAICTLTLSGLCHADSKKRVFIVETASIESVSFKLEHNGGQGVITARSCPTCPEVKLIATTATRAFANNVSVPMERVPELYTGPLTVVYKPSTMIAERIYW